MGGRKRRGAGRAASRYRVELAKGGVGWLRAVDVVEETLASVILETVSEGGVTTVTQPSEEARFAERDESADQRGEIERSQRLGSCR